MESNVWGIWPTEFKVLIEPDEADELAGRAKVLFKPDTVRDREAMAKIKGTLIAIGGTSFTDPEWGEPTPKVGDRVYFAKYAGIRLQRVAGENEHGRAIIKEAVLCNDKDIAAVIDPSVPDVIEE